MRQQTKANRRTSRVAAISKDTQAKENTITLQPKGGEDNIKYNIPNPNKPATMIRSKATKPWKNCNEDPTATSIKLAHFIGN